jgi:hypothetical protein
MTSLSALLVALAAEVNNDDDTPFDVLYGQLVAYVGEDVAETFWLALCANRLAQADATAVDCATKVATWMMPSAPSEAGARHPAMLPVLARCA